MRALKVIVLYLAVVVLLGALLSPWSFWLVQWLANHHWYPESLAAPMFRRVHDRTVLVVAALALWPLLRGLGIRTWREVGFIRTGGWWRPALWGVALGLASFATVGALLLVLGTRRLDPHYATVTKYLFKFVLTGIVVALIEETLFRGGLLSALRRSGNDWLAIIVTSALFSIVHFLKPDEVKVPDAAVTWLSGFWYSREVLAQAFHSPGEVLGFVTLFLAGSVLAVARVRTGALYLALGLHAGWVFTEKTFSRMTEWTTYRPWWGGGELVNNALVWPLLVGVLLVVIWLSRTKLQPPPD